MRPRPDATLHGLTRRRMLGLSTGGITLGGGSLVFGSAVTGNLLSRLDDRREHTIARFDYPFTLGIGSGDPWPDSVVLWTRLLPDAAGFTPLSHKKVPVEWQVAHDDRFTSLAAHGSVDARRDEGHSVHIEATGLDPDRWYYYRFRSGGHISEVGRTRTAPAVTHQPPLRFITASCQSLPDGYFSAYRHMMAADPDFVVFLGDWIYDSDATAIDNPVRSHRGGDPATLADYRFRHALYRSDPDLQAASAAIPFVATLDDHEVVDNWYSGTDPADPANSDFLKRRQAAFQAFYEHLPLRPSTRPRDGAMRLNRSLAWGATMDLLMLDTRQYRDDIACGGGKRSGDCAELRDADRGMLGADQEEWLLGRLGASTARWRALGQQVPMGRYDYEPDPKVTKYLMDRWDGYPKARDRLLRFASDRRLRNLMVLSGDAHAHMATDLTLDMADPDSKPLASDLVCTSISTLGDGADDARLEGPPNPHLRFSLWRRGYIDHFVDAKAWQADFQVVPYVSSPGADLETRASFTVESGNPGLQQN